MPAPKYNPKQDAANRHAYIPPHVEQAMAKQIEQRMPAHMKKYVGAYMQQNVVNPTGGRPTSMSGSTSPSPSYKPVTHLPRKDHFHQYKVQRPPSTRWEGSTDQAAAAAQAAPAEGSAEPQAAQAAPSPETPPPQSSSGQPDFDFIMNSPKPSRRSLPSLGGGSLITKIGMVAGLLLVVLVAFVFLRGFLAGESPLLRFVSVAQDQQQLLHLVDGAKTQQSLSGDNQTFVATAQLSLKSSQNELVEYLTTNGQKVDAKQLSLGVDPKLDEQLEAAVAATTYNETFKEVMESELTDYMGGLQQAFQQPGVGETGKTLLAKSFSQAELLQEQLKASN